MDSGGTPYSGISERLFRLFVEAVKDYAIYMIDPDGVVVTWNAGAEFLKGYRADEIVGQHFSCFYIEDDRRCGVPKQLLAMAARHGHVEAEGWRVKKDGSLFWANVTITPLHDEDGTLVGFGKVTQDLTERRRADERLRKTNEDLERRVAERTVTLAERIAELEQFHEVAVSRELKMMDLEKKVAAQEQQLAALKSHAR